MSYKLVIFRKNRGYNAVSRRFGLPTSNKKTEVCVVETGQYFMLLFPRENKHWSNLIHCTMVSKDENHRSDG